MVCGQRIRRGRSRRHRRGLPSGQTRLLLPSIASAVLCLADWVLVEDLGFLGGLGTDPNSMIPLLLLITGGYVAVTRRRRRPRRAGHALSPGSAARRQPARHLTPAAPGVGPPRLARPPRAGRAGPSVRVGQRPGHPGGLGRRRRAARRRPDGTGAGQPERRPDHRAGARRLDRAARLRAAPFRLTDQNGRPVIAGQPARQGRAADLPRPGVHHRLPAHRAGTAGRRPDAGAKVANVEIVAIAANPLYTQR